MSQTFRERIEAALRARYGRSWQDRGERLFGWERGDLLSLDSVDADAAEIIENIVHNEMLAQAADFQAKADKAAAEAKAFDMASRRRRTQLELAALADHDAFVERFLEVCHPNRTPEAA